MFKDFIKQKNCFKLILGANNENYEEITNLTALYSLAGCKFFDINASIESINAAKKGLEFSGKQGYICISVGTKDDPHLAKCKINKNSCTGCKKCIDFCLQNAINVNSNSIAVNEKKCIGCKKCMSICQNNAIETYQKEIDFEKIISEIKNHCDCIEYHIVSSDKEEIFEKWKYLCSNYSGYLSIALNRSVFSDKDIKNILTKMLEIRSEGVIIQADGIPMSGSEDNFNTTLQAISTADIINKMNFNVPVIVSGGVNSKTIELADMCNVDIHGVAAGSWARKKVREYTNKKDFLKNKKNLDDALFVAKEVTKSLTKLGKEMN